MVFTQYLRPDGRAKENIIEMEPEIEEKAAALIKKGCYFDIEVLRTGLVSMTCEQPEECKEADSRLIAIRTCQNGPDIKEMIKELVEDSYVSIFVEKVNYE